MADEIQKVILELNADYKPLAESLQQVNKAIGVSNQLHVKMGEEITQLTAREVQLTEARAKSNNPSSIVKYTEEINKVKSRIDELTKAQSASATAQGKFNKTLSESGKTSEKVLKDLTKAFNVSQINAAKKSVEELGKKIDDVFKPDKGEAQDPIGDIPKDAKPAISSLKDLKKAYREAVNEAIALGENTPGGKEALARAGELKDRIGDVSNATKNLGQDFKQLSGALGVVTSLAGGFSVVQGATALLGDENEDLNKALLKVQASMAILNGLQEVSLLLQKDSAASIFLQEAALKAQTFATQASTVATRIFNAVLNANPIFIVIGAIISLVAVIAGIAGAFDGAGEAFNSFVKFVTFGMIDNTQATAQYNKALKDLDARQEKLIKTGEKKLKQIRETIELEKKQSDARLRQIEREIKLAEAQGASTTALNKKLLKEKLASINSQLEGEIKIQKQILQNQEGNKKVEQERLDLLKRRADAQKNLQEQTSMGFLDYFTLTDELLEKETNAAKSSYKTEKIFSDLKNKERAKLNKDQKEKLAELVEAQKDAQTDLEAFLSETGKAASDKYRDTLDDLRKQLQDIRDENSALIVDTTLKDEERINASFDLKKEIFNRELDEQRKKLRAEGVLTKQTDDLINKIRIENNNKFEMERNEQLKQFLNEQKKIQIEAQKEISDLEIELSEMGVIADKTNFEARFLAAKTYYDTRIRLARELGESEEEIRILELKQSIILKEIKRDQLNEEIKLNTEAYDEESRHLIAMAQLRKANALDILDIQLAAEKAQLEMLLQYNDEESNIVQAQKNRIEELEEEKARTQIDIDREKTERILSNIQEIVDATIAATQKIIGAKIQETDRLIQLQQQRVDAVTDIADKGNAELFELEKKRLDDLNKEKEKFVRQQQALAVVELIANSAIAIAKAAAQGGAAAPITIAATLIALIAGLASAKQAAQSAAFYEGGLYEGEGYTGLGNPRERSYGVGPKPYEYHKREFIFNHQKTDKYLEMFKRIHTGEIDLNQWKDKVSAFDALNFDNMELNRPVIMVDIPGGGDVLELKGTMKEILFAIEHMPSSNIALDIKGFTANIRGHIEQYNKIDKLAH